MPGAELALTRRFSRSRSRLTLGIVLIALSLGCADGAHAKNPPGGKGVAENRVSAFLNVGDTKNPLFQPALQLYAKIEPEVAAAKEKARTAAEKEIENLISSADYAGAKQAVIRHANAGAIADRNQYFAKIDAAAEAKRQAAEAAKSAAQRREKKFQD